tara:strand:+ start:261 stop:689 length:429 start_codon:yes stop_codon:yes gene_type:complete
MACAQPVKDDRKRLAQAAVELNKRNTRKTGDEEHGTNLPKHTRNQAEEQATKVQEKQSFLESLPRTASTCFGHGILFSHEHRNGGVSIMTQTGFINAQWNCGSRIARSLRRIANSVVFHLVGSNPTCRAKHRTNGKTEQKRR